MTPEQITEGLYTWLMDSSRIGNIPMGFRPCTWTQLKVADPATATMWRLGVDSFLDHIGAQSDDDAHLNFIGSTVLEETPLASDDDPGLEHRITHDGG